MEMADFCRFLIERGKGVRPLRKNFRQLRPFNAYGTLNGHSGLSLK